MTDQAKLRTQTSRGDGKRQAILAAAETVFLRAGFAGASMDEIAADAGVSKQTVYSHFCTKKDLFIEAIARVSAAVSAPVREVVPAEAAPEALETHLADY